MRKSASTAFDPELGMTTSYTYLETPIGCLLIAGGKDGLSSIEFDNGRRTVAPEPDWEKRPSALREAIRQLEAYFAGDLKIFDLQLAPKGTPFQLEVWTALQKIPYGATTSYGELAQSIGRPGSARAVGAANGKNPLPIVIPCHRVIGASGALTGFGGGLEVKSSLLALEARQSRILFD